jgi:hypothetical protein
MTRLYKIVCDSASGPKNRMMRRSTFLINLNTVSHVEVATTHLTINFNSVQTSGSFIIFASDPNRLQLTYKDEAAARAEFEKIETQMSELK